MINLIIVLLLVCAVSAFTYYFYQQRRISVSNHCEKEDPDVILGLKKTTNEINNETNNKTNQANNTLIVLYLMAPEHHRYGGYELLQALLSAGLRYGKQQIFHRHECNDGEGAELFHCASAEKPGSFDLSRIGDFTTSGLSLFFSVNQVNDPLETFDILLDTVDQLVEDLSGSVFDAEHELLTKAKVVEMRQWLLVMSERKNTLDLFAETH